MADVSRPTIVGDIYTNFIDSYTGESVNYKKINTYHDGTIMNDSKCDGIIYRKKDTDYFVDVDFLSGNPINVRRFGAKGNINLFKDDVTGMWYQNVELTIPANIDTAYIQKALNICKHVYFGNSKYLIDNELLITIRGQHISGLSRNTVIQNYSNNHHCFNINAQDININNLSLIGTNKTVTKKTAGIYITNSNHSNFDNIIIRDHCVGYNAENANMGIVNNITNSWITYIASAGILLGGICHATKIRGCEIQACRFGIVIGKVLSTGIIDYDLDMVPVSSTSITDNTIEGNTFCDIYVNPGTRATKINGNYFEVEQWGVNVDCFIKLGNKYNNDGSINSNKYIVGVNIENNFFDVNYQNAAEFPYFNFGNTNSVNIQGNSFNNNRKLIGDNFGICTNINLGLNYLVNPNSMITSGAKGWLKKYPVAKDGYNQTYMIWDDSSQSFIEGVLMIPSKVGNPLQLNRVPLRVQLPIEFPTKDIINSRIISSVAGAFTITTNKTKSIEYKRYLSIEIYLLLNISTNCQIIIDLTDVIPEGKTIIGANTVNKIGNINISGITGYNEVMINNNSYQIKLLKGSDSQLDVNANTLITGTINVYFE